MAEREGNLRRAWTSAHTSQGCFGSRPSTDQPCHQFPGLARTPPFSVPAQWRDWPRQRRQSSRNHSRAPGVQETRSSRTPHHRVPCVGSFPAPCVVRDDVNALGDILHARVPASEKPNRCQPTFRLVSRGRTVVGSSVNDKLASRVHLRRGDQRPQGILACDPKDRLRRLRPHPASGI